MMAKNNISPISSDFEQIKNRMKAVQSIGLLVICALH